MNIDQTLEPGKIITIKFSGPAKKPLNISINNGLLHRKRGAVYISPFTPLAQAIMNCKAGDSIEFNSPEGRLGIKIIGISA